MLSDFVLQINQQIGEEALTGGGLAAMAGIFLLVLVFTIIFKLAVYVYLSFAFMEIGKKAKDRLYGLAWIPYIGNALIAYRATQMHWWPWLILAPVPFLFIASFLPFIGFLFSLLMMLFLLAFTVFKVIWMWKMFEKLQRPGWWAVLMIIPIANLIIAGLAAWTDVGKS